MDDQMIAPEGTAEAPSANEFASLATIFTNPKRTFEAMAPRPRFILGLILAVLVLTALTAVAFQSGVVREEALAKLEAQGKPEAQIDATAKMFDSPLGLVFALVGNVIGIPFVILVSAGLLLFMGNLMLGAKLRFPHYLSATVYGSVVGIVDHAVRTGIMVAKQSYDVRLGLGNLFGDELPYFGRVLDSATDPLLLWSAAVTALGVAVYARKGFGFGVIAALPGFVAGLLMSGIR
jgi:hypothetical protein